MYPHEQSQLNHVYTYHAPTTDQIPHYEELRSSGKYLATEIMERCPDSRERSLALTKVEEAVMWANAAIARVKPVVAVLVLAFLPLWGCTAPQARQGADAVQAAAALTPFSEAVKLVVSPMAARMDQLAAQNQKLEEEGGKPKHLSLQDWLFIATGIGGSVAGLNTYRNSTRKTEMAKRA